MFFKKGVLKNFTKTTGKQLRRISFLIKLQAYSKFFTGYYFSNFLELPSGIWCGKTNLVKIIESAIGGVLWKNLFVKISQILLENTCVVVSSCEYLEIFKNTYFKAETLENEIYSSFLMSENIHSLLGKVKEVYQISFTVKGIWYSVKN